MAKCESESRTEGSLKPSFLYGGRVGTLWVQNPINPVFYMIILMNTDLLYHKIKILRF